MSVMNDSLKSAVQQVAKRATRTTGVSLICLMSVASVALVGCSSDTATAPAAPRPSQFTDPAGDFLSTFTGPHNGDLDVLSGEVSYDGTNFVFTSTMSGAIGATPGAAYVWGVNRGAGTARFAPATPGVVFDFIVIAVPGGASTTRDLVTNTSTALAASAVVTSGSTLTVTVPASLLTSQGFTPANYTVNLWPKTTGGISDFAPDNSMAPVRVLP